MNDKKNNDLHYLLGLVFTGPVLITAIGFASLIQQDYHHNKKALQPLQANTAPDTVSMDKPRPATTTAAKILVFQP